jgi:hypothetical protein
MPSFLNTIEKIPNVGWVVIALIAVLIFIVLMKKGAKLMFGNKTVEVANDSGEKLNLDLFGLMYVMSDSCHQIEQKKKEEIDDIIPDMSYKISSLSNIACLNLRVESILNSRRRKNGFENLVSKEKIDSYINAIVLEIKTKLSSECRNTVLCTSHEIEPINDENIRSVTEVFVIKAIKACIKEYTNKKELYQKYLPLYKSMNDKNRVDFCESKIKKHSDRIDSLNNAMSDYKGVSEW